MRLHYLTRGELDATARRVWDAVVSSRRGSTADLVTRDGGLVGPFNPLLYAPVVGERVAALGETLRFDSSLDPRLLELAIISVGRHWNADFEWAVHSDLARRAGVSEDVVLAIRAGDEPDFGDPAAAVVHGVVRQLLGNGAIDDDSYARAVQLLGESEVVQLVAVVGYYTLVCFILNAFEVPAPDGADRLGDEVPSPRHYPRSDRA